MPVRARYGAVVIAAILVGGCSGSEEPQQPPQAFTAADATRIASVRPTTPDWNWPQNPEKPISSDSSGESDSTDPLVVELKSQMAKFDGKGEAANRWRDDNKVGNLAVGVYANPSDAHEALAAFNAFSRIGRAKWRQHQRRGDRGYR